jgi:NTE family protein
LKKAIAFSGGGSKGSYQIGAWSALNEFGYEFDIAVGTSIGSINAAFYAQEEYDYCFFETASFAFFTILSASRPNI